MSAVIVHSVKYKYIFDQVSLKYADCMCFGVALGMAMTRLRILERLVLFNDGLSVFPFCTHSMLCRQYSKQGCKKCMCGPVAAARVCTQFHNFFPIKMRERGAI